jgi:hypothetical protein
MGRDSAGLSARWSHILKPLQVPASYSISSFHHFMSSIPPIESRQWPAESSTIRIPKHALFHIPGTYRAFRLSHDVCFQCITWASDDTSQGQTSQRCGYGKPSVYRHGIPQHTCSTSWCGSHPIQSGFGDRRTHPPAPDLGRLLPLQPAPAGQC